MSSSLAACSGSAEHRSASLEVARAYMGVSCRLPNSIRCDGVGLAVWLPRRATRLEASIAGKPVTMRARGAAGDARFGRKRFRSVAYYEGFLQPAGLLDGPLRVRPDKGRHRWLGRHPVSATVHLTAHYGSGQPARRTIRVDLAAGWG